MELKAVGAARREIDRAVASGVLTRHGRGVLALPEASATAVWLARERAILTCASAAEHYGLWLLRRPSRLHVVTRTGNAGLHVNHYFRGADRCAGPRVAELKDAVVQALRCLPDLEALVIAESAVFRHGLELEYLMDQTQGRRNAKARAVVELVEPGADSLLETIGRVLFRRAGFDVKCQVHLDGIGWVDFLIDGWLIVEFDGSQHGEPRQYKKDNRRGNLSLTKGAATLRFNYEDVVYDADRMLATIREVLVLGPRSRNGLF